MGLTYILHLIFRGTKRDPNFGNPPRNSSGSSSGGGFRSGGTGASSGSARSRHGSNHNGDFGFRE